MHARTLIRAAVVAALLEATAAGDRVQPTRVLNLRKVELPALAVYTLSESVDEESIGSAPRELERRLELIIEGWVYPTDGTAVDDALDALAREVEIAMHADPYLGGAAADSQLSSSEMEVVEDGDRLLGFLLLTYAVHYRTFAPEPPDDDELDDFTTAQAVYNLAGSQDAADTSSDLFSVEES